jgi:hypothetical protein
VLGSRIRIRAGGKRFIPDLLAVRLSSDFGVSSGDRLAVNTISVAKLIRMAPQEARRHIDLRSKAARAETPRRPDRFKGGDRRRDTSMSFHNAESLQSPPLHDMIWHPGASLSGALSNVPSVATMSSCFKGLETPLEISHVSHNTSRRISSHHSITCSAERLHDYSPRYLIPTRIIGFRFGGEKVLCPERFATTGQRTTRDNGCR